MRKLLSLFITVLILITSNFSVYAAETTSSSTSVQPFSSDNRGENSYARIIALNTKDGTKIKAYDNYCASPVKSHLIKSGTTYIRVENKDDSIIEEKLDSNLNVTSTKTVKMKLPVYGGFYSDGKNYYVLSGQNNKPYSSSKEVFNVTKYDKNWKELGVLSYKGANTLVPFASGSARFADYNNNLYIKTSNQMSNGHQANVMIQVDTEKMELIQTKTSSLFGVEGNGHVSHSFNQYIIIDDNQNLVTLDQGDTYPRAAILGNYSTKAGVDYFNKGPIYTLYNYQRLLEYSKFPEFSEIQNGDDYTESCMGGLEYSKNNYITVGNYRQNTEKGETIRDIYVTVTPRNEDGLTGETKLIYLTDNNKTKKNSVGNPHLIKYNDNSFAVIWEQIDPKEKTLTGKLSYIFIDGDGNKVGSVKEAEGYLSDCKPVVSGTKAYWYVTDSKTFKLYNLSKSGTLSVTEPSTSILATAVKLNKSTTTLSVGDTETLTATITPTNVSVNKVNWSSSNTSVATVNSTGKVTAKSAGTATITVATTDGSNKKATCKVTVQNKTVAVTSVKLNKTSLDLKVGNSEKLVPTILPNNATNKEVTWKSSNTSVLTVSTTGKVTAKAAGNATVTVTTKDGNKTATCKVTVNQKIVSVTSVQLDKTSLSLNVGDTTTLNATVSPSNATNKEVTWKSSNTSVLSVSTVGKLTAKASGNATVTVTTKDGNKIATCKVTVNQKNVSVTSVQLDKTVLTLNVGDTTTLNATISPSNATNKEITWKSNNTSVVTVTSTGKITAIATGTATVTVTTKDGNKTATVTIKVQKNSTSIKVTDVLLSQNNLILKVGETYQLSATVKPDNATDKTLVWITNNYSVARVSGGLITAVKPGTAVISAQAADAGLVKGTCTVTVIDNNSTQDSNLVKEIYFSLKSITEPVNATVPLYLNIYPQQATNKTIKWTVSDPSIAEIISEDKEELVLLTKKAGNAVITASTTDGSNLKAEFKLEVSSNAYFTPVTGISLNPTPCKVQVGALTQINALFTPSLPSNRLIVWKSSNPEIADVAKVGDSKCQILGKKEGIVTLTATTVDGNKTASIQVTVTK